MLALPPAPYGVPVCQSPGINDLIVKIAAIGTSQFKPPKLKPPKDHFGTVFETTLTAGKTRIVTPLYIVSFFE
jgi:hypothetical protein